jgi:branched-subunit amino acid aminotransferase/4-amino-4-deoxychorismate lyase
LELIALYADELSEAMKQSTGQGTVTASSRTVTVSEFHEASEAFCTGTAAELVPIAKLASGEGEEAFEVVFPHGQLLPGGPVTAALLKILREAMVGKRVVPGWLRDPFAPVAKFIE